MMTTTAMFENLGYFKLFQPLNFDWVWWGNDGTTILLQNCHIKYLVQTLESLRQSQSISIWPNYLFNPIWSNPNRF